MTEQTPLPTPAPSVRHDGWTPARRTQFLDRLAADGSVSAACARIGMSREAAYQLRRRDARFARAWSAALLLAREASAEVLGTRAIDGVEEDVWYRGEVVGTRRKYDTRLLLAHMARLDRIAENESVRADAARFDELLALVADEPVPEGIDCDAGGLPIEREAHAQRVAEEVGRMVDADWPAEQAAREHEEELEIGEKEELSAEERAERAIARAWTDAHDRAGTVAEAAALALQDWDAWYGQAAGAVDVLLASDLGTLSGLSSSPAAGAAPSLGDCYAEANPLNRQYARA